MSTQAKSSSSESSRTLKEVGAGRSSITGEEVADALSQLLADAKTLETLKERSTITPSGTGLGSITPSGRMIAPPQLLMKLLRNHKVQASARWSEHLAHKLADIWITEVAMRVYYKVEEQIYAKET